MPAERILHHWEQGAVSWQGWQPLPLTSSSFSTSATSRKSLLPPLLSLLGAAVLEQLPDPVARPGGTLAQGGDQELSGVVVFTLPWLQVHPSQQDQHKTWSSF